MRITGGEWGGRTLKAPADGVRPTQDRVRASMFSSLAAFVPGSRVLDLFAGAGSLGLEALSRGAAFACFVEQHPKTARQLRHNVEALAGAGGRDRFKIVVADATDFARLAALGHAFDLVLADPPYERGGGNRILGLVLAGLAESGLAEPGAVLVYEQARETPPLEHEAWSLFKDRSMGETRVLMYRRR